MYSEGSLSRPSSGTHPSSGTTYSICNTNLPITSVHANGNNGNPSVNAVDDNLNTAWMNNGIPSWIRINLEPPMHVCHIGVAWFKGNLISYSFTISTSNDGMSFLPIYNGRSSGTNDYFEHYYFTDKFAKFIKITVYDNTENMPASIKEIRVYGH